MNNFNTVFLAIRQHCSNINNTADENHFQLIADAANVPVQKLDFFLKTLQDLGLIKYSWKNKTIQLTSFGKKQERLFSEKEK
jgi:hypothetical protein